MVQLHGLREINQSNNVPADLDFMARKVDKNRQ